MRVSTCGAFVKRVIWVGLRRRDGDVPAGGQQVRTCAIKYCPWPSAWPPRYISWYFTLRHSRSTKMSSRHRPAPSMLRSCRRGFAVEYDWPCMPECTFSGAKYFISCYLKNGVYPNAGGSDISSLSRRTLGAENYFRRTVRYLGFPCSSAPVMLPPFAR